ncbi:MAG: lipopolysaccharide kinase InaA family protein [Phycisphaerae bacterium]|jgi:tRNA A-37 threonylcarbamoyl transferase component Bud32
MAYQSINIAGFNLKLSDNFPTDGDFVGDGNIVIADGSRGLFTKLASSKFANVFKFDLLFQGKVYSLILKQYLARKWFDVLMNAIGCGRSKRAFKAGLMLRKNGFLTPPIAAAGKKGLSADFIITAEIKNSVPLYKILESKEPQRRLVIEQFAQTVGRMHACGICHGDLRLGNVLVKSDDKFDFYFLDNERTKKFRKLPDRLRLKNLIQINMLRDGLSNADRLRFFKEYLKQQNIKLNATELAAKIIAGTNKRLAEKGIIAYYNL